MPNHWLTIIGQVNADHIKPHRPIVQAVAFDELHGEDVQLSLLVFVDADLGSRALFAAARESAFDLDDDDGSLVRCLGDEVDFTLGVFQIAGKDAVALFFKESLSRLLTARPRPGGRQKTRQP